MTGKLLEGGAVDGIGFWDPKDAGIVMNKVAQLLLDGKRVSNGMSLGVKGYEKVKYGSTTFFVLVHTGPSGLDGRRGLRRSVQPRRWHEHHRQPDPLVP